MKRGKQKKPKAKTLASSKRESSKAKLTFADAVNACPQPVAAALHKGKQALKKAHRAQVECRDETRWTGSIELDEALKSDPEHANASRWDYGLGYQSPNGLESALWVEVHSAETGEVSTVLRKLRWLKDYLPANCPELWSLTAQTPENLRFVWVASGRYAIPSNAPQLRALRTAGLDPPVRRLEAP